jgi:CubicO group peptidase (beta-lactamase class C family)
MRATHTAFVVATIMTAVPACSGETESVAPGSTAAATAARASTTPSTAAVTSTVAPTTTTAATSVAPPPTIAANDVIGAALDAVVPGQLAELQVPGAAVVVIENGVVVYSNGFGTTPDGAPITADTLFQVGSTSKMIAAITAASLAADQQLPWDTDLAPTLTSWTIPAGAQTADHPVTVAGITSHTAGFTVDGFLGYAPTEIPPSRPAFLSGEGNTDPVVVDIEPASAYRYSGGGYEVLAQAIEDATGKRYADVVAERVFGPAGMTASGYLHPLPDDIAATATGGMLAGEPVAAKWQLHPEHAAAGLWSTGTDMGALFVALTDALRGESDALLDQEWATRLATPAIADSDGGSVGHGTFITDNGKWFSHGGRNIGYISSNAISVDGRYAIAVLTNGFPGGSEVGRTIMSTVADARNWPDWS